jgi:hypothetical protein
VLAPWVIDEMATVDLNDERLNKRLRTLLSRLGARPNLSIPAACNGHAETEAAYRFFDNEKCGFHDVLQPHIDRTRKRVAAQPLALFVPDTTEIDLTRPQQQVQDAGPLDGGARRGPFLHPMHAFTPDGTPLGTIAAIPWAREDGKPTNASRTRGQRAATPIEEKESYRWLLSLRQAREEASRCPDTRIVFVADSEADIYDLLAEAADEPHSLDWIVRSCQDRALVDDTEGAALERLRAQAQPAPVLYQETVTVRGRSAKVACEDRGRRQPRKTREAVVEVRATQVTLRAPQASAGQLADVTVNVVLVSEVDPPADDVAVEWLLLTILPIDTPDQVRLIVEYYCARWLVEIFIRTLKVGCRVEKRRFETLERQLSHLAVSLIVAWRTFYVCRLGRSCPDVSCEVLFEPDEWRPVYQVVEGKKPPKAPPKLQAVVRLVARLGGYVSRKKGDEPGPQTVWLGLQRMHDMALCWRLFGPAARRNKTDARLDE